MYEYTRQWQDKVQLLVHRLTGKEYRCKKGFVETLETSQSLENS